MKVLILLGVLVVMVNMQKEKKKIEVQQDFFKNCETNIRESEHALFVLLVRRETNVAAAGGLLCTYNTTAPGLILFIILPYIISLWSNRTTYWTYVHNIG